MSLLGGIKQLVLLLDKRAAMRKVSSARPGLRSSPPCTRGPRPVPTAGACVAAPLCARVGLPWSSLFAVQVDGVSYLLQEIYGIENKYNTQDAKASAARALPVPSRGSEEPGQAGTGRPGPELAASSGPEGVSRPSFQMTVLKP